MLKKSDGLQNKISSAMMNKNQLQLKCLLTLSTIHSFATVVATFIIVYFFFFFFSLSFCWTALVNEKRAEKLWSAVFRFPLSCCLAKHLDEEKELYYRPFYSVLLIKNFFYSFKFYLIVTIFFINDLFIFSFLYHSTYSHFKQNVF